jgi:hypothetical protein
MRLLGVYNIFQLDTADTVYLLARLAEVLDENFDYLHFFGYSRGEGRESS